MIEVFTAVTIVVSLGFIYIAILGATASMLYTAPNTKQSESEEEDDEAATETVIRKQPGSVCINASIDVFNYVNHRIGDEPAEYLILLLVSADNRLVAEFQCTDKQGGYVRFPNIAMIIHHCVEEEASSIFIAHNHPHGTLYPSMEDIYYTAKLVQKLQKAGIRLKDHIIVTKNRYYSMKDNDKCGVVFP